MKADFTQCDISLQNMTPYYSFRSLPRNKRLLGGLKNQSCMNYSDYQKY